MAENKFNNHDALAQQVPENIPPPAKKTQSRALWVLFLAFFVLVAIVFLTQHRDTIDWIEDYEAGIKLAKQQNKPVLLAFYKQDNSYYFEVMQTTYNNPDVIEYLEANFIPILIYADKQPEIAKRYNINDYPTHYIKQPNSNQLVGPYVGYDTARTFRKQLKTMLGKMNLPAQ